MPLFGSPLGLLIELVIVHSIEDVLLDGGHHVVLELLFQLFFLESFLFLDLFLVLSFLLDLLDVLFILPLEVLVGLGQLILCDFDEGFELLGGVTTN